MSQSTETQRIWHDGPPPHVGWWNASLYKGGHVWRWWDGKCWSSSANTGEDARQAARLADVKTPFSNTVQWTDYYPKNARVPRRAP